MSECVVRIEMPENCFKCPLHKFGGTCGFITGITAEERMNIDKRRPANCPIICSLPEGHGRLADVSEVYAQMHKYGFLAPDMTAHEFVEDELTTIVPAERSET